MKVERTTDAALVLEVEKAAGNVRGLREVQRRVDMSDTFLARDASGAPIAVGTLRIYERGDDATLAWIGGMSTRPDARRQAAARAVLRAMLARADEREVRALGLDASEMGRPLYEREGFVAIGTSSRWKGVGTPRARRPDAAHHAVHPISVSEAMEIAAFDAERFGANRMPWLMALMRDFPWQAFMTRDRRTGDVSGFVFGNDRALGPLVADDPDAASALLAACERAGALRVVLPESDARADVAELLTGAGYAPDGVRVTRMTRGGLPLPGRRSSVYAAATWAMG